MIFKEEISHDDVPIVIDLAELEDIRSQPSVEVTLPGCYSWTSFLPQRTAPKGYSKLTTSSDTLFSMWPISLVERDSTVIEFLVDSLEDQRQWNNRLKLFALYPYSPVPSEPLLNPAKDLSSEKLNPAKYNAG